MYSQTLYFLIILLNAVIEPENTRWVANMPINILNQISDVLNESSIGGESKPRYKWIFFKKCLVHFCSTKRDVLQNVRYKREWLWSSNVSIWNKCTLCIITEPRPGLKMTYNCPGNYTLSQINCLLPEVLLIISDTLINYLKYQCFY